MSARCEFHAYNTGIPREGCHDCGVAEDLADATRRREAHATAGLRWWSRVSVSLGIPSKRVPLFERYPKSATYQACWSVWLFPIRVTVTVW